MNRFLSKDKDMVTKIYFAVLGGFFNSIEPACWKEVGKYSFEGEMVKKIAIHLGKREVKAIHKAILPTFSHELCNGTYCEVYLLTMDATFRAKNITQAVMSFDKATVDMMASLSNGGKALSDTQELSLEDINIGEPEWVNDAFQAIQETLKKKMPNREVKKTTKKKS